MANNPLSQNLPADLPTNWQNGQIVAPNGASVGLSTQHGYNYLMQQGNASQNAINTIGAAFSGVFGKNETIPVANGGTGATTATNARTNLSVYSQSEVNNLLSPMNSSISSLGSTKLNTIGKGVNLLDNWYFVGGGSQQGGGQFPINQRGQTNYDNVTMHGIDRWESYGAPVAIESDCIAVTYNGGSYGINFQQELDPALAYTFAGKTLTMSLLKTNGELLSGSVTLQNPYNGQYILAYDGNVEKLILGSQPGSFIFYIQGYGTATTSRYVAAKLELGDTQTLARQENGQWVLNDPPPNYALELVKCSMSIALSTDSYSNFPFLHITSGSYVGTGTYGSSTPNSLSFSFAPKIIWCSSNISKFTSDGYISQLYAPIITTTDTQYGGFCEDAKNACYGRKSSDGKTFYWYTTSTAYGGSAQNNASGTTYYYTAIG